MIIHQILHGYNNGHNLLASSIILPLEEDMDRVFIQSDWDEYSSYDSDTSYLTIYPLKKSGYIVVAKSWYADDMDRPGCVWTQSLLVKMDEIEQKFNFEELLDVFRRPKRDNYDMYRKPIYVNSEDFRAQPLSKNISSSMVSELLKILALGEITLTFGVELASIEYQKLVLRLVQYLPTELLSEISICSGTLLHRKIDGRPFSLQFNPQSDNYLSLLPKEEKDETLRFWGLAVHNDMRSIYKLTRLFSDDIGKSYKKLLSSIKLIYLLIQAHQEGEKIKMEHVLEIILTAFPTKEDGMVVKQNFLRQSVTKIFCSEQYFIYLMCSILVEDAFDYNAFDFEDRIKSLRENETQEDYQHLIMDLLRRDSLNSVGQQVLESGVSMLNEEAILRFAKKDWEEYLRAVRKYDALMVKKPVWIDLDKNCFKQIYINFSQKKRPSFNHCAKLVSKLLEYDIDFTYDANIDFYLMHEKIIDLVWGYYNHTEKRQVLEGVNIITNVKIEDFIRWIGEQFSFTFLVDQYIMQHITPDSELVKSKGSDIWMGWMHSLKNNHVIIRDFDCDYYTFLFLLSFNWKDSNSISYLKLSFNRLHYIFSTGYEDKLVWIPIKDFFYGFWWWWEYWDKCRLLRVGVVRYLISIGMSISILDDFCDTPSLTQEMKEIWEKEMR